MLDYIKFHIILSNLMENFKDIKYFKVPLFKLLDVLKGMEDEEIMQQDQMKMYFFISLIFLFLLIFWGYVLLFPYVLNFSPFLKCKTPS